MNLSVLTIGSDPEQMLLHRKSNKIVSAIPVLKTDKYTPIDLGDGFKTYADNVMIESNVPPAHSCDEFVNNFRTLFNKISKKIGEEYKLESIASHTFTKEECEHEWAKVAGCNPEYDAYQLEVCYPPEFKGAFRSAGGHIHIGRKDYKDHLDNAEDVLLIDPYNKADVIKLMDIFVGATLTLVDQDPTSYARKTLYGACGRHRPTEYGVEYRTPGNYWLRSPKLVELIYNLTRHAVEVNTDKDQREFIISSVSEEDVVKAINKNNKKVAREIVNSTLPNKFIEQINELEKPQKFELYAEWGLK